MVNTQYKEIAEYLKEAKLALENAEDIIRNKIKKISEYLDENPDEGQSFELGFLKIWLEDIEDIIGMIEDIIRDLQS